MTQHRTTSVIHPIIVGDTLFGKEIRDECTRRHIPQSEVRKLKRANNGAASNHVLLYADASAENLAKSLARCKKTGMPFIMLATGEKLTQELMRRLNRKRKTPRNFIVVLAPNASDEILLLQSGLPRLRRSGYRIATYTVSHQLRKTDPPGGTALAIAAEMKFDEAHIRVVKTLDEQRVLGVPEDALDRHAYHLLTFVTDDGRIFEQRSMIHGLGAYVNGALALAETVVRNRLAISVGAVHQAHEISRRFC